MQYNKRKISNNYYVLSIFFIHLFGIFYSNKEFYLIVSHENNVTLQEKQAHWYKKICLFYSY